MPRYLPEIHGLSLAIAFAALLFPQSRAQQNLLKNPGFEEAGQLPNWTAWEASGGAIKVSAKEAHAGQNALILPPSTASAQQTSLAPAGAYLARCWVKSEADQPVTLLIEDTERPWISYTYAETKVPRGQWVKVETFCAVDQDAKLTFAVGGMSEEFRKYHGAGGEMKAPILVDDCELVRYQPAVSAQPVVWDAGKELGVAVDWSAKSAWRSVEEESHHFAGTAVFQDGSLAGAVRPDGSIALYALRDQKAVLRSALAPSPAYGACSCAWVQRTGKPGSRGLRVSSTKDDRSYTVWLSNRGVLDVEPVRTAKFVLSDCQLRYGLLPSFSGTDICYSPKKMSTASEVGIPSTQWFVGLVDGNDSMMVVVWNKDSQPASLGLAGSSENRMIQQFSIGTEGAGFSVSWVEHASLWHKETLNEDWLGEYTAVSWQPPFPARWMGQFFVSPGKKASFREPHMDYSFPFARMKSRMWGVWFEDWNHYPYFFDGPRTVVHFEKTFVPAGEALAYFLEPAAADLCSPCEIVEQVLGASQASALLDWDANGLRKLHYSTPNLFMYDRPVCATTTRLSHITGTEKSTVGVNLATHLYEFVREIRARVDQFVAFFNQMQSALEAEKKAHPESSSYISELEPLLSEAQAKAKEAYATPLETVLNKTENMKNQLRQGKGDGFDCGNLDVRGPAGTQDDLCRRYNRAVLRLMQTAALNCGDTPENAVIAKHVWDQSRQILRQPTRWEPRRTLYFFEP
jgi:hypothetical protein